MFLTGDGIVELGEPPIWRVPSRAGKSVLGRMIFEAANRVRNAYVVHHYQNGIIGAGVIRAQDPVDAASRYMAANEFDYTPDSVFKVVSVETGRIDWVGYERIKG